MTFYDDAELTAVAITRLVAAETDGKGTSAAVSTMLDEFIERNDTESGTDAVVIALARIVAAALHSNAFANDITVDELLDRVELGKLEQIVGEQDNPED